MKSDKPINGINCIIINTMILLYDRLGLSYPLKSRCCMALADLYVLLLMPIELRKAHEDNDKAVMKAYRFKSSMKEDEIVAELFKLYQQKIEEIEKK